MQNKKDTKQIQIQSTNQNHGNGQQQIVQNQNFTDTNYEQEIENNANNDELLSQQSIDVQMDYIEPQTHAQRKGNYEKLFGNCLHMDYDLNKQEIKAFIDLKIQCNKLFNSERRSHNKLVINLWYLWKQTSLKESEINQEEWKVFGFQQKNPRTDFRGAGITGLKQLIHFTQQNLNFVKDEMLKEENEFIYAVSSINVTFLLLKYFQLLEFLQYDKDKEVMCGRKAFKTFAKFLSQDPTFFYNLHCLVLKDLFYTWKNMKKRDPKITLLDFGRAQEDNKEKLKRYFSSQEYPSFKDFKMKYEESMTI